MSDDPDLTPCYRADCPECGGWIAVAVAPIDEPYCLTRALRDRDRWERQGYRIEIATVDSIRAGPKPGHVAGCSRDKRRKARI